MTEQQKIEAFLAGDAFAVAGASTDRSKYGNKVLRVYQQNGLAAYPINPKAKEIEGVACYASLANLPEPVHGLSIVTPPAVTATIVRQAIEAGVQHLWMQPGAESEEAVEMAEKAGLNVLAGGPCILVSLRFRDV